MSNFQPLEVVDRGSETELHVVENYNKCTQSVELYPLEFVSGIATPNLNLNLNLI